MNNAFEFNQSHAQNLLHKFELIEALMQAEQTSETTQQLTQVVAEISTDIQPFSFSMASRAEQLAEDAMKHIEDFKYLNLFLMLTKNIYVMNLTNWLDTEVVLLPEIAGGFLNFVANNQFDAKITSRAIFAISRGIARTDAMNSYILGLEAFKVNPCLAAEYGSDYVYNFQDKNDHIFETCPICGGKEATAHYCMPQAFMDNTNTLAPVKLWVKCTQCENIFSYNFPVQSVGEINGHFTPNAEVYNIRPIFSLRICGDILNKCANFTTGNQYLEIGVGNGEMLATAMEMGYDVTAVEICKQDCENISSVLNADITWCDFLDYKTDKKFDVIVMGDVIEHTYDPIAAIEKAKALLNDDGVLWISTPNFNSGFSRLMKFKDPMWNQKNHVTYFSFEGLERVLNSLGLVTVHYDVSNRYNGSMELFIQHQK